jgi:hypothetical protein
MLGRESIALHGLTSGCGECPARNSAPGAGHPTADDRTFGDLRAKDELDHVVIKTVERVPYTPPYTYDILPASSSGAYFAGGVLIGSTLKAHGDSP